MDTKTTHFRPRSLSVDTNAQNEMVLHFHTYADGVLEVMEIALTPELVAAAMRDVANTGTFLLARVADAWRRGDCGRCRNVRLVQVWRDATKAGPVPPGTTGGTRQVHCPDCTKPGEPLRDYPKIPLRAN